MRKKIIVLLVLLLIPACVFAAKFHSVPLEHKAYSFIEIAEIRGIIPVQTDVKPYNVNTVRNLLSAIANSDRVSGEEKLEIRDMLSDFDSLYGNEPSGLGDLFKKGYVRTSGKSSATAGGKVSSDSVIGYSTTSEKVLDSRNEVMAYVNGDILDYLSYDINFSVGINRIDLKADILTDLKINCDGFYMRLLHQGDRLRDLPDGNIYTGITTLSEVSTSINNDMITARIGTLKRDWGPGMNNLGLSGSARAYDGFELSINPTSWFSYSVSTGSLGFVSIDTVNGVKWPSENMDKKEGKYYNNLSIHRVEITPVRGLKFSVWESVVWRKRFELSYLNPFAIYMFAQNSLGDYDNMLAGFDISYTIPGVGKFYLALGMDELNSFRIFSNPRNIIPVQFGAKFSLDFLNFSELGLQVTYIPAFFGAHYASNDKIFGNVNYTTAYVNKGQPLSYPVNPDTLELLANLSSSLGSGWRINCTVKDQMRSAQYATKTTGTDILTHMSYTGADNGEYKDRNFFGYIWNNILDSEVTVEKKFDSFPLTLNFGLRVIWDSTRSFTLPPLPSDTSFAPNFQYNPGGVASFGEWRNSLTVNALIGLKLYY